MPPNPIIRVEASQELLTELLEAHEAVKRARTRAKKPTQAAALNAILVQVSAARMRIGPKLLESGDGQQPG